MNQKLLEILQTGLPFGIGMAFLLGSMIWIIMRIRSGLLDAEDSMTEHRSLLDQIEESYQQGEMTEQEYRSIKSRVLRQQGERLLETTPTTSTTPKQDFISTSQSVSLLEKESPPTRSS